jgi:competence protein ComEC
MLVDAGTASGTFDVGDRIVTPALWALGIRHLEWLAFTHPDLDHIGGAASVLATFRPREIWEGVPVPTDPKRSALEAAAGARRVPWREVRRGDVLQTGGVTVEVLNPPVPDWERRRTRNDDSIVLRLRYGEAEFLLTGDIGEAVEPALGVEGERPPLRVLKVAHHGSRTSSSDAFVRAYGPSVALVSVGRNNVFGHPAREVLGRFEGRGSRVFRTDRDGALIVETDGRLIRVRTWTGGTWTVVVARAPPAPS